MTTPRFDWDSIRAEYEAGASQSELAKKYGVSRTAIQKHITSESWSQDISKTLNQLTEAKVAGVVAGCNPKKKAAALNQAAEDRAQVIERHRREWRAHEAIIVQVMADRDFEGAKLAKITAETLKIRQEGERKAWGIAEVKESHEITVTTGKDILDKVKDVYGLEELP